MGKLCEPPTFESIVDTLCAIIDALVQRGIIADDGSKSIMPCLMESLLMEDAALWPDAERTYLARRREALEDELARLEAVDVAPQYWPGSGCDCGPGRAEQARLDYMDAIRSDIADIDARLAAIPANPPSHARIREGLALLVCEALVRESMPNEPADRLAAVVNDIARAAFGIGARAASKARTDLKGRMRNDRALLAGFRARWPWIERALLPECRSRAGRGSWELPEGWRDRLV